ncbi:hypothetical protein KR059_003261, partial [Drosophila kikkawai]
FSDFYKLWLETKLTIQAMSDNGHSKDMLKFIECREKALVSNDVMVSAIYLDPRLRRIFIKKPDQQVLAKSHLLSLMRRMVLKNKKGGSLISKYLNSFDECSENETSEEDPELKLAEMEINRYSPKSLDPNTNIMEYWESKKYTYPCLYALAKVVRCVPATEVSV